jgi:hypothetical protein
MKTNIENYIIDVSTGNFSLSYSRSIKNVLTLAFFVISTLVCLSVSIFLVYLIAKEGFNWVYLIISALFGFVGIIQMDKSYASLKTPSKNILIWNKNQNYLTLRNHEKKAEIKLSDLNVIEYQMQSNTITLDGRPKNRFWIVVTLVLRGGLRESLIQMDLVRIITFENPKYKTELKKSAKNLTSLIAKQLNIEARWKGEKKI